MPHSKLEVMLGAATNLVAHFIMAQPENNQLRTAT